MAPFPTGYATGEWNRTESPVVPEVAPVPPRHPPVEPQFWPTGMQTFWQQVQPALHGQGRFVSGSSGVQPISVPSKASRTPPRALRAPPLPERRGAFSLAPQKFVSGSYGLLAIRKKAPLRSGRGGARSARGGVLFVKPRSKSVPYAQKRVWYATANPLGMPSIVSEPALALAFALASS